MQKSLLCICALRRPIPVRRVARSIRMVPLASCSLAGSPVTVPVTPGPEVLPMTMGVGDDVCQVLACQVNMALLEQRENLRVDERIPVGTAFGEIGILPC